MEKELNGKMLVIPEHVAIILDGNGRFPTRRSSDLAMFDRWKKTDLEDSRYVWLPIQIEGGVLTIPWRDKWNMDVFDK